MKHVVSEHLTELQEGAKNLRALDEARRDTMRDLVGRGRALCELFGAELHVPPAYHEEDPASHASFYLQLVRELEAAVPLLDRFVEAECRQLLSVVATWIFSNLWLLHPVEALRFPFGEHLQPIPARVEAALREKVAEHVEALQKMCTCEGGSDAKARRRVSWRRRFGSG